MPHVITTEAQNILEKFQELGLSRKTMVRIIVKDEKSSVSSMNKVLPSIIVQNDEYLDEDEATLKEIGANYEDYKKNGGKTLEQIGKDYKLN